MQQHSEASNEWTLFKMNYSFTFQESRFAFQNVFQEHPTESHNTQETLQISSVCGLRKSMARFHNITHLLQQNILTQLIQPSTVAQSECLKLIVPRKKNTP